MKIGKEAGMMAIRPRILHVSADFPDSIEAFKTPVIRSLLDLTADRFRHEVISLNRRSPGVLAFGRGLVSGLGEPPLEVGQQRFAYGQALIYQAPPRGLFHATMLRKLGNWLAEDCLEGPLPDLLVGHKLAVEGMAVQHAASRLDLPYSICIQGDTDTKILAARPDLTAQFARVFHDAEVVFPFTPWALRQVEERLGRRSKPAVMLPCPTDLDTLTPPRSRGNGLVSVFHLKNYRRKNLQGLVDALQLVAKEGLEVRLDIIGGGSEHDFEKCRSIASRLPMVEFTGPLDRHALRERLNKATALVLPSLRESFGLVFIEALFAGLPVIYPKGNAIDGYFDACSFALAVDARDATAIAAAIKRVMSEEAQLKEALLKWQHSDDALIFRRHAIGETFAKGLLCSLDVRERAPIC